MDRTEKYEAFVALDNATNLGRIVNSYEQINYFLEHPEVNRIFAKRAENELLSYAVKFSDFYKQYAGFKSLQDFPIVDKAFLKAHWDEIAVKEYVNDPSICIKYTSGSTGTPFKMIMDRQKHACWIAENKSFRAIVGVVSHEKTLYTSATGRDDSIPKERQDRDNVYYRTLKYLDKESLGNLVIFLEKGGFRTMTSMAVLLDEMARLIRGGEAPEWKGCLIAIFSVSEPLKNSTRKTISEYFKCPVYVFYANEENGVLGVEDGSELGCRANNVDFALEVLKMDSDEPAEDGEVGRLVLTDYYNKAFPIIRYANGDLVCVKRLDDGRMYITEILGRIIDTLYTTDGRIVHYFDGVSLIEKFQDIKQFQLIQEDYHHFTWILNTTNHSHEGVIVNECKSLFGNDSEWKFEYVDEIPKLQSGKSRMTVCKIKR